METRIFHGLQNRLRRSLPAGNRSRMKERDDLKAEARQPSGRNSTRQRKRRSIRSAPPATAIAATIRRGSTVSSLHCRRVGEAAHVPQAVHHGPRPFRTALRARRMIGLYTKVVLSEMRSAPHLAELFLERLGNEAQEELLRSGSARGSRSGPGVARLQPADTRVRSPHGLGLEG